MSTLLIVIIMLPLAGAGVLGLMSPGKGRGGREVALLITVLTLVMSAALITNYLRAAPGDQMFAASDVSWLSPASGIDIRFSVGLDGVSLWLFGLSALLFVSCVLVSWQAVTDRPLLFYAMLLLLECGCLGVFAARDIILFYVFFEFTLIPLFFLIGIWGSEQRRYAAIKFFLFTLAGSLFTFLGLLAIVLWVGSASGYQRMTFSIPEVTAALQSQPLPVAWGRWIFVALFAGFAIKVPLFPLHTWLPLAHVQAPTAGSVILAGILLKIGTYGFVRFSLPMLPEATAYFMPWLLWLSVAGIIYGALVALAQTDMKRLIAYSSVSHLGFCMLGLFALNHLGEQGALLQMVNHGLSTGALFALVGMLYERVHTRQISELGGLAGQVPVLAFFMLLFTLASIGLPGLNGFAGEILILLGMFQRAWLQSGPDWQLLTIAVFAVLGVVLGAWYMLWLVQRVFFGPVRLPSGNHERLADLSLREVCALVPLAIFVVWIGIQPQFFLVPVQPALNQLTQAAEAEVPGAATTGLVTAKGSRALAVLQDGEAGSPDGVRRPPTAVAADDLPSPAGPRDGPPH